MRRKTASNISAILLAVVTGLFILWLEVSQKITQDNSYWLIIGICIGGFLIIVVLIWGYWPTIKWIRFQTPIRQIKRPGETKTETENSKVEKKLRIFSNLLMLSHQHTHKCSQCGFGVVVNKYDTGVVCPKCGNADDITLRL